MIKDRVGRRTVEFLGITTPSPNGPIIVVGRVRKTTDPARTRRLLERYEALRAALMDGRDPAWPGPRVPVVVAAEVAAGWIESEAFPGLSLSRLPDGPARDAVRTGVVRALAALEQDETATLRWPRREWSAAREIENLARLWSLTGNSWPAAVMHLARAMAKDGEGARVPAHRDLNEEQVLVDPRLPPDGRRWVDWDQASFAPAGLDLGNFLAHERLRALRHGAEAAMLGPTARDELVEAYQRAGGQARRRVVRAWEAVSCLRLAALARHRDAARAVVRNPRFVPTSAPDAACGSRWAAALERTAEGLAGASD